MRKPGSFFNNTSRIQNDFTGLIFFLAIVCLLTAWYACNPRNKTPGESVIQLPGNDTSRWPASFGVGRTATSAEITALDIDVRPDGTGLPTGSGNVASGKIIYAQKCAVCHGKTGVEGPFNKLVGILGDTSKAKTIGNYWPYATTLFDYIRRAMPYNEPGSLTNNEVYSLTAYLLHNNKIVDSVIQLDAYALAKVIMPAKEFYVNDDRQGGPEIK